MTWTFSSARHVNAPDGDLRRGSEGLTGAAIYTERVRDRQAAEQASKPEALRPKTDAELAGEAGLAEYDRIQERKAREEQARLDKIAARKAVEALEKKLQSECGFSPSDAARRARELVRRTA
jgi:hypothetical protein